MLTLRSPKSESGVGDVSVTVNAVDRLKAGSGKYLWRNSSTVGARWRCGGPSSSAWICRRSAPASTRSRSVISRLDTWSTKPTGYSCAVVWQSGRICTSLLPADRRQRRADRCDRAGETARASQPVPSRPGRRRSAIGRGISRERRHLRKTAAAGGTRPGARPAKPSPSPRDPSKGVQG